MKASYRWLKELSGVDASAEEFAAKLTSLGLEVEETLVMGTGLDAIVVAEVVEVVKVADRDKLSLVTVFDGAVERTVICGAANVPGPGGRVVLARPGARLPGGMEIAERKVGGVLSQGMLCSETELDIGAGEQGILVLGPEDSGRPGDLVSESLALEDTVFEIGITPNRPDCLGHIGLAREIALGFGEAFRVPEPGHPSRVMTGRPDLGGEELSLLGAAGAAGGDTLTLVDPASGTPSDLPISVSDSSRCPRYAGCVIQGVRVDTSPFWLRYRLHCLGVRAIDNVVDTTNLVLFESGHPLHAFDLDTLRGPELRIRLAEAGEVMVTLDGEKRVLTDDDLLICDAGGPIALAGVMGGSESQITADTRNVVVEVAYFDPRSIRRTSRRTGIHTDSSHRFERGVDPNGVHWAMRRAVSLITLLAQGAAAPSARDIYPTTLAGAHIALDPSDVGKLLGMDVPEVETRRALDGIGCSISPAEGGGWRVSTPTWRPDLSRPQDLIEEVARVRGYDAIPSTLPPVLPSAQQISPRLRFSRKLKESAAALGLLEAINYAFLSRRELEHTKLTLPVVALANPLSDERAVMRTSLLPGLLGDVRRARRHQVASVELFEVARTYHPREGQPLPIEPLELAFVLAGNRREHLRAVEPFDFFDGKGVLESIIEAACNAGISTESDEDLEARAPYLHPRRRATVKVGGRVVGEIGEVHPDVTDAHELDVRVIYGRVSIDSLIEAVAELGTPQAVSLPKYPAIQRDLAVVVSEDTTAASVEAVILKAGGALLEGAEIFDVYRGDSIGPSQKSMAYRVIYRDPEATLTDKKVQKVHKAVLKAVEQELGGSLRAV